MGNKTDGEEVDDWDEWGTRDAGLGGPLSELQWLGAEQGTAVEQQSQLAGIVGRNNDIVG